MPTDDLNVRIRMIDARLAQVEAQRTAKAISGVGKAAKGAGRDAKEGATHFNAFRETTGRLRGVVGAVGLGGLAVAFKDSIGAAQKFQEQQAQLQGSLKNTGIYLGKNAHQVEDITKAVEASSTKGGFAAPEQLKAMTQFIGLTKSTRQATVLNTEAMNMARQGHMDYARAVTLVSKAQNGTLGKLSTYFKGFQATTSAVGALTAAQKKQNPEVLAHAKLLDKQTTAMRINALISQRFANGMANHSHTTAGAIDNARNAVDNLSQKLGAVLLPVVAKVARGLVAFIGFLKQHRDITMAAATALGVLATAFGITKVVNFFTNALKDAKAAMVALKIATLGEDAALVANPIGLAVVAFAALAAGVVYAYNHFKTFREVVQGVFGWLGGAVSTVVSFFTDHWKEIGAVLAAPFIAIPGFVATHFGDVKRIVGDVVGWIVDKFNWKVDHVKQALSTITSLPGKALHGLTHPFGLHIPGLATGGIIPSPGRPVQRFAAGGLAGYGTDTVPAMLSPGEGVLRRRVVDAMGAHNFHALNQGAPPFAGSSEPTIIKHYTILDSRVLAETVTHYANKMTARR